MILIALIFRVTSKVIIEFNELERRSPDDVCREYQNNYIWKKTVPCYIPRDDCIYGNHSNEDIESTEKRINFFRKLTGLVDVKQSKTANYINWANQASLVMDKNDILDHRLLNTSLKCWTYEAQQGAMFSNLLKINNNACSTDAVTKFIEDINNPTLNNRRWLLNPPLSEYSASSTNKYVSILVMGVPGASNPNPKFIAYPPPGPIPSHLIFNDWSFSRHYDKDFSSEHDQMPDDTEVRIKCDEKERDIEIDYQESIFNAYPGIVRFTGGNVKAGSYCKVAISSKSANTEWRYTVLAINCIDGKAYDVNGNAFKDDYKFKNKKGISTLAIIGIVLGCVCFVAIILFIVFFVIKRRNKNGEFSSSLNLINS